MIDRAFINSFDFAFCCVKYLALVCKVQRQAQAQQQGLAQGIPRQQLIQQQQQPQPHVLIRGQLPAGLTPQQQLQWLQQHQQRQLQGQTVVINQQQQQQQLLQQNPQLRQQQVKIQRDFTFFLYVKLLVIQSSVLYTIFCYIFHTHPPPPKFSTQILGI